MLFVSIHLYCIIHTCCGNFVTILRFAIHLNSFITSDMVIIVIIITLVLVIITISLEFSGQELSSLHMQRKPVKRINQLTYLLT
jgi:hypothetical protein